MRKTSIVIISIFFLFACSNSPNQNETIDSISEYEKVAPAWVKNANIYEVNVRQHTAEGTFSALQSDLLRMKNLGIDILWLMPIHPIGQENRKGTLGSPYSVKDYKGINPDLGTNEEFKSLIKAAHRLDMKIIIDWVANHSAFDNVWTKEHKDWYLLDAEGNLQPPLGTDWWDVTQFNYENTGLHDAMIDALKYWVQEFDIDGYRCDVAGKVPMGFWNRARKELDEIKPVFMLAEAEGPQFHEFAFDMTYAWEMHHIMNQVAQGKMPVKNLQEYFKREEGRFKKEDIQMQFTTNHDENSWNGTIEERMGVQGDAWFVFASVIPGMPLIYSGQEAGLNKRLEFFEKDSIDWKQNDRSDFYRKLLDLKHKNPSIWNGEYGGEFTSRITEDQPEVFYVKRQTEDQEIVAIFYFGKTEALVDKANLDIERAELYMSGNSKVNEERLILKEGGYVLFATQ